MKLEELSGYALEGFGWKREGNDYKRGFSVIKYNGVSWFLDGKKIESEDVPEEIITIPPMTEDEIRDYYEDMMGQQ